jgi:3-hydroxyacyl-[acyl-carrier-protein] dehydratase
VSEGLRFSIPGEHASLAGHFPGHPLVPGVLLLEHALAAIEAAHGPLHALRLPQVKFVRPLLPGEPAQVEFEAVATDAPDVRRWRFRVLRGDGVLLASGEVAAAMGVAA